MANENWMRRYILKAGQKGKKGFEVGNIQSATQDALHISFSIEKSDAESPNAAKVQIWNLTDQHIKVLESKDCVIELKAGYGDKMVLILLGTITSAITTRSNADRMTELSVVDSFTELRDTYINVSLNGKVNSKTVYNTIANKMGLPIKFGKEVKFKNIPNGYSYVGKAKNALHKIATFNKNVWSIQDGIILVAVPGCAVKTSGYLLSEKTGLIDIPRKITISTDKKKEKSGWEVKYFLNGAIGVNDTVQLKSDHANGYFRVLKVTMDGDNMEGDWICTAQIVRVK